MDCSELGGGFKLAMNDLQIRGGGNLLGVSQSGHIAAVGYDLYLELLQSTVADLKRKAAEGTESITTTDIDPEIKLKVAAFLPDSYIQDTSQRYQAYRRIAVAGNGTEEELADLQEELIDRYGSLPREAQTLLAIIGLKQQLRTLGINKLEQGPDALIFSFVPNAPVEPQRLLNIIQQKTDKKRPAKSIRLTPDQRLIVPISSHDELFARIQAILQTLKG
jgi:transcription-repair coupling factor (superfamily II helicase)